MRPRGGRGADAAVGCESASRVIGGAAGAVVRSCVSSARDAWRVAVRGGGSVGAQRSHGDVVAEVGVAERRRERAVRVAPLALGRAVGGARVAHVPRH
eukprot:1871839-Prymnesium_polylepis.1